MSRSWKDVWDARTLNRSKTSVLDRLMEADGLDTGFGSVSEASWREFVLRIGDRMQIAEGTRVFEVGCGAGAFLYPLYQRGSAVGGLDQSAALIDFARGAMPEGRWRHGDAASLDTSEHDEVVLACGVFMYFPDHDYAWDVLTRMAAKATRAVALLDVPDRDRRDAALAFRRGSMGEAEYAEKYRGLDHLYYDRGEVASRLRQLGASTVTIDDQHIDGYANARFRFNAIATWR